jgi:hypothetical protein
MEQSRVLTRYVPSLLLIVAASVVLFIFLGLSHRASTKSIVEYGVIMAAYASVMVFWLPARMRRKMAKFWETYVLEIGPDYLLRRQSDLPDLRIDFSKVQTVQTVPGRYLRIAGTPKSQIITVPEAIERDEEVLQAVSGLHKVEVQRLEVWQKNRVLLGIGLVAFPIMLWAESASVVVPLSLFLIALIAWMLIWAKRNPNLRARTKWLMFVTYVPITLVCAMKILVALVPPR